MSSHLSMIPLMALTIFSAFWKVFDKTVFAVSLLKLPPAVKPNSSKIHRVEQHQELKVGSSGREQFAKHKSLTSGLSSSGTEQHSVGFLEKFGQTLQLFVTASSALVDSKL